MDGWVDTYRETDRQRTANSINHRRESLIRTLITEPWRAEPGRACRILLGAFKIC